MNEKVDVKRLEEDNFYFNLIGCSIILDCGTCVFNNAIISKKILAIVGEDKKSKFAKFLFPRVDILINEMEEQGFVKEFLGAYINKSKEG